MFFSARALLCLLSLMAGSVFAHEASYSTIEVDTTGQSLVLSVKLPEAPLAQAYPALISALDASSRLQAYLAEHLWLTQNNQRLVPDQLLITRDNDSQHGVDIPVVQFTLHYPAVSSELVLHSDAILHRVISHRTQVVLKQLNQRAAVETTSVGLLRLKNTDLQINTQQISALQTIQSMLLYGIEHILLGKDHLLFLICLLFAMPLLGTGAKTGESFAKSPLSIGTLKLVTAFTVAHSVALLFALFAWFPLARTGIEVAVALSVFFSALLLIKPLPRVQGYQLAAIFGLVHGLAFSEVFAQMGVEGWRLAAPLLGFTFGVEFIQLLLVLLIVPCVAQVATDKRLYFLLRMLVVMVAVPASLGWVLELLQGEPNLLVRATDKVLSVLQWLYFPLLAFALSRRYLSTRNNSKTVMSTI